MNTKNKSITLLALYRIFLGLGILEGLLALWFLFRIPSEARHASLLNFSLARLGMGSAVTLVLGIFVFCLYDSLRTKRFTTYLANRLEAYLAHATAHVILKTLLILLLASSLASLVFYWFPDSQRLVFFLPNNYIFKVLGARAAALIIWVFLLSLKASIFYAFSGKKAASQAAVPFQLMAVTWTVEAFILGLFVLWSVFARQLSSAQFIGPGLKVAVLAVWFTFWAWLDRNRKWAGQVFHPFVCISIWLCVFIVSLQFDQWFNIWGARPDDQFINLADAFLHGKLYMLRTLSYLHDLTLYNGHWYLACPPFPILLITPFVAIWGVNHFNINTFSLVLEAFSAVTVYLILYRLSQLGWIKLNRRGAVWLTALFVFGTVFWWLSILGTAGFFAQVVTVIFCALAFFIALQKWSPWLAGICLGAAVLSRPNVFVLWPALLFIIIQLNQKDEKVAWKPVIRWGLQSAVPVTVGAALLLLYNYLRFGNFMDFGYATINGAALIVKNVQTFGLFSLHFAPKNLSTMFLALPQLEAACAWFFPKADGMSMLMTTPAIIYLLRRFKLSWWTLGCWVSILLSIVLLALYSNNGANQYGYRYLMDFIIPVIMLVACNAGERVSGVLKILIIASIIINYYGMISWLVVAC